MSIEIAGRLDIGFDSLAQYTANTHSSLGERVLAVDELIYSAGITLADPSAYSDVQLRGMVFNLCDVANILPESREAEANIAKKVARAVRDAQSDWPVRQAEYAGIILDSFLELEDVEPAKHAIDTIIWLWGKTADDTYAPTTKNIQTLMRYMKGADTLDCLSDSSLDKYVHYLLPELSQGSEKYVHTHIQDIAKMVQIVYRSPELAYRMINWLANRYGLDSNELHEEFIQSTSAHVERTPIVLQQRLFSLFDY